MFRVHDHIHTLIEDGLKSLLLGSCHSTTARGTVGEACKVVSSGVSKVYLKILFCIVLYCILNCSHRERTVGTMENRKCSTVGEHDGDWRGRKARGWSSSAVEEDGGWPGTVENVRRRGVEHAMVMGVRSCWSMPAGRECASLAERGHDAIHTVTLRA
jgi:hypothetical protein